MVFDVLQFYYNVSRYNFDAFMLTDLLALLNLGIHFYYQFWVFFFFFLSPLLSLSGTQTILIFNLLPPIIGRYLGIDFC